jgi:hypothetical protein
MLRKKEHHGGEIASLLILIGTRVVPALREKYSKNLLMRASKMVGNQKKRIRKRMVERGPTERGPTERGPTERGPTERGYGINYKMEGTLQA